MNTLQCEEMEMMLHEERTFAFQSLALLFHTLNIYILLHTT
jgi:hypothetical protein